MNQNEIKILKDTLFIMSKEAKIYLFGSRTDDSKKGGDIDLLVLSDTLSKKDIRKLRIEFIKNFGEQKIDIVLDSFSLSTPFCKYIFPKAIKL